MLQSLTRLEVFSTKHVEFACPFSKRGQFPLLADLLAALLARRFNSGFIPYPFLVMKQIGK
jgi:hypothetical protein